MKRVIFIWAALTFLPHTSDLSALLSTQAYSIIETPIALQVIIAFVTYLWVYSANRAIERAHPEERHSLQLRQIRL
jgi:methylglyoxal synthase